MPNLRNLIQSEPRQVVRVVDEGKTSRARIVVERITPEGDAPTRQKWDETRFFRHLDADAAPTAIREFALQLRDLARRYPESVAVSWGTGKHGSMVLKRHNGALIEVRGRGHIRFRPSKFARALGDAAAAEYRQALEELVPKAMAMNYPRVPAGEAARVAPALFELIRRTLERIEAGGSGRS